MRPWMRLGTFGLLLLAGLGAMSVAWATGPAHARVGAAPGAFRVGPLATATPCGGAVIANGGFESGSLPPWTIVAGNSPPVVSTAQAHSGSYAALLGSRGNPEPNGDSAIAQQITVPAGGGTLSYWYWPYSQDTLSFDWQDAYVTDPTGQVLATIMHVDRTDQVWLNVTFDLSAFAGQTVRLEFLVHEDGGSDPTAMYVDDITLATACASPPPAPSGTGTPPPGTATPRPSPTPSPGACPPDLIGNGGFESGDLAPWVVAGAESPPAVSTAEAHSGRYAALLGSLANPEPQGDSAIAQQVAVPAGGGTLTFWYWPYSTDGIAFDWQDARITDPAGHVLATVLHVCSTAQTWQPVTFDMAPFAGQTVRIEFLVHEDGGRDPTAMYVDDVTLAAPCGSPTPALSPTAQATVSPPASPTATAAAVPSGTPVASGTVTGTPSTTTATATPASTPCPLTFTDVLPADYFYTPVLYLACRGVISGYGNPDGTLSFRPYNATTRGQMVKIVVLGFARPLVTPPGTATFADVPPSQPFFAYIETAAADGIAGGYTCGGPGEICDPQRRPYFRPAANVTRGQLAKIVVNAAGWPLQTPAGPSFVDVGPNTAFYTFVETAYCHQILSGYACGGPGESCDGTGRPYFRQYDNATRGQIAKIVYGALTSPAACPAP